MQGTRLRSLLAAAGIALGMLACGGALSPSQRVSDAVHEMSNGMRFGRMDVAIDRVSRAERANFAKRHARWGSGIRILDCEVAGIAIRDKSHADVSLAVGWQRVDETDVRSTQIAQKWTDQKGQWLLESEERAAGDVGLLGEQVAVIRPSSGKDVQFQSITIR